MGNDAWWKEFWIPGFGTDMPGQDRWVKPVLANPPLPPAGKQSFSAQEQVMPTAATWGPLNPGLINKFGFKSWPIPF